jgi:predicted MPP superfamily phosphohydrolase
MARPRQLLRRAAALFDDPALPLAAAAEGSYDFSTGARWMHLAMETIRGTRLPAMAPGFQLAGIVKYALASGAALSFFLLAHSVRSLWPLALVIPAFYAAEVQLVFLFPLMLDRHPRPIRQSLRLTHRSGGTLGAMATVLPLAAFMLFGGFFGQGFRRAWCLGCLAVTLWYEAARRRLPHIRHESFGGFALRSPVTVLFASDLHLGRCWTRRAATELLRAARHTRPDLILLGGDLLDSVRGAGILTGLLKRLAARCPVYLTSGNHDLAQLAQVARSAGAYWLPDQPASFQTRSGQVIAITAHPPVNLESPHILCLHDPAAAPANAYRLAFAGHLHGGQCVLASHRGKLFPGYLVNRFTVLRRVSAESSLFVSRGLADTLPLRFNCPKEVIICRIC